MSATIAASQNAERRVVDHDVFLLTLSIK